MLSKKPKISAQLISSPTNIYYLTGFKGVSETEKEAFLLILKGNVSTHHSGERGTSVSRIHNRSWTSQDDKKIYSYYLFTSGLYLEQANLQVKNTPPDGISKNIRIIEISKDKPLSKQIKLILRKNRISALEYEPESLTVSEYNKLKKDLSDISWSPIKEPIENQRLIKNSWEIEQIKKAAKLTDQCFSFIIKHLKARVTESQIAWEIEKFIREKRGQLAFSPIVAFGEHSNQPHYISMNFELRTNNLILLDFGARINGYCSDMTRIIFFGKPNLKQQKVYNTVLLAQQKAINSLADLARKSSMQEANSLKNSHILIYEKTAISGADLDKLAKDYIEQKGFPPYSHSLGHGLGLDIHEQPRLTIKKNPSTSSGQALKPGMIFTIEPAVYLQGEFGIRIEDTVLLTETGLEILTNSPKNLIAIK